MLMYYNEHIMKLKGYWKWTLPPSCTQLVLTSFPHVLWLCHSFKGCALPPSLLFQRILSFFKFIYLFIYFCFWLCWVFVAVRELPLVAASGVTLRCSAQASHCSSFSCCRACVLGVHFSSCGSRALELRLSSCGAQAQLLCGMWESSWTRGRSCVPALAGGFSATVPPGKSQKILINKKMI